MREANRNVRAIATLAACAAVILPARLDAAPAAAVAWPNAAPAPRPQDGAPATHSFGAPLPPGTQEPAPAPPKASPRPEEPAGNGAPGSGTKPSRLPPVAGSTDLAWPHDPVLAKLEAERDALESVDHAAHHAMLDAARRVAAMHAFIDQHELESDWARFARDYVPSLDQLTFDDAVAQAKRHAAGAPKVAPSNDVGHLEQAIAVEAGVARASWNQLNRQRRAVDVLTAFLQSKDRLAYYQAWAPGFMRRMGWKPEAPSPGDAPPDAVRRRGLQMEWDRAQREQRAAAAQSSSPQLPPNAVPLVPPGGTPAGGTPAPSPQHGVVPAPVSISASPARSVYANSWWNGYADPYYDMSGYPGRDPNLTTVDPNDPATYGYAPEAYSYRAWPMFWDLGWVTVPPLGMFGGGSVGGVGFGLGGGMMGGAVGGVGIGP